MGKSPWYSFIDARALLIYLLYTHLLLIRYYVEDFNQHKITVNPLRSKIPGVDMYNFMIAMLANMNTK